MLSWWEKELLETETEITVLGAGIVGLSAAFFYKNRYPDARVRVLEKQSLPCGATTRNAGFACFGTVGELLADLQQLQPGEAAELVRNRFNGLQALLALHGKTNIGYEACGGFEVFFEGEETKADKIIQAIPSINQLLRDKAGFTEDVFSLLPENICRERIPKAIAMIYNPLEGALHSGKLWKSLEQKALQAGVEIRYGIQVENIHENADCVNIQVQSGNEKIILKTQKLLVALNGFAPALMPALKSELKPARGVVIVTSQLQNPLKAGTYHYKNGDTYFRHLPDGRILLGGGRSLNPEREFTDSHSIPDDLVAYLSDLLNKKIIPEQRWTLEHVWAGTMGIGSSKQPICKLISAKTALAVRLGGMGVALGTELGKKAASLWETKHNHNPRP